MQEFSTVRNQHSFDACVVLHLIQSFCKGYLSSEFPLPGQLSVPTDQLHPFSGWQAEEYVVDLVMCSTQLERETITEQTMAWTNACNHSICCGNC